jgi:hypothetical protein
LSGCDSARENLDYKFNLFYEGGRYKINVPLDCRAGGDHGDTRHIFPVSSVPGILRPGPRTCLETTASFETWDPYWSFYGLVFAASNDWSTVYSFEVNNLGDWAILRRTGYQYPGPNHPFLNETRDPVEPGADWSGKQRTPARTAFERNKLRVEVGLTEVIFYINDSKVYTITNPTIVNQIRAHPKIGIIGGDWEITPTQIGFDYYIVDEGCDTY